MANKFLQTRIQLKKDTASNWESANPVLLDGEQIIIITSAGETRHKVGDGTKTYTQLPFTDEPIRNLISGKVDKVEGKQLCREDYTAEEKTKLAGITVMVGANETSVGTQGLVPAPAAGSQDKFLKADGTWSDLPPSGSTFTIYRYTASHAGGTN